ELYLDLVGSIHCVLLIGLPYHGTDVLPRSVHTSRAKSNMNAGHCEAGGKRATNALFGALPGLPPPRPSRSLSDFDALGLRQGLHSGLPALLRAELRERHGCAVLRGPRRWLRFRHLPRCLADDPEGIL